MLPGPSLLKNGGAAIVALLWITFLVFLDQHGLHNLYNWLAMISTLGLGILFVVITLWWALGPKK